MKRLNKRQTWPTMIMLTLLLFLASCSSDDPAAPANRAPAAAAIDTEAGAPADAATGVAPGTVLRWTCSDPDGDSLTYIVRLGTATTPPIVATDQTASHHTPSGLLAGTLYYWQVTAKDSGGKTTSSAVWSFTTAVETVAAPNKPGGPAVGLTDDVLDFTVTGGASSLSHDLEYRFDWDDGDYSAWSATMSASHAWTAPGAYDVMVQARCADHNTMISAWSTDLNVTISDEEIVSAPDLPDGPSEFTTQMGQLFQASGSISSYGHTVEYRFDWGDGTRSMWAANGSVSRLWTDTGVFDVTAQARCVDDPDIESVWSEALTITVTEAVETVGVPDAPTGPVAGLTDESLAFSATAVTSNLHHSVEYQFSWGDGTSSAFGSNTNVAHAWTAAGSYEVKVRARCITHTSVESIYSAALTVEITAPAVETIGTPDAPSGPATGEMLDYLTYTTSAVTSSEGHTILYVFDWDDGPNFSYSNSGSASHQWTSPGTYNVRVKARCQLHQDVESAWSETTPVVITTTGEVINAPDLPSSITGFTEINNDISVFCYSTYNNLGHAMEYRFDFGDGTISDWLPFNGGYYHTVTYAWTTTGVYTIRAQARCAEHTDIESPWSDDNDAFVITINNGTETISAPTVAPTGPINRNINQQYTYAISGNTDMGHQIEVKMDWGNGDFSEWTTDAFNWDTIYLYYTYTESGTYLISGQARCVAHPEVISEWSVTSTIIVP
jgi:PKD domain